MVQQISVYSDCFEATKGKRLKKIGPVSPFSKWKEEINVMLNTFIKRNF